jgi:molecular chaperone GrpE
VDVPDFSDFSNTMEAMAEHGSMGPTEVTQRDPVAGDAVADGDVRPDRAPPDVREAGPPPELEPQPPEPEPEPVVPADAAAGAAGIDELQRDLAVLSDRYLRLAAEFDNYRKRSERERADAWARAQAELAARLLDTLDDLERVMQYAASSSAESLLEGVELVERKLRATLASAGLEAVEAEGAAFDPNSMEAVATVGTDERAQDDVVSDVFQRGYTFRGTLLRPARVRVKKHGA